MSKRKLAFVGSIAAVLAFATQALAAPMPYSATTSMPTLTLNGVTYDIGNLNNGNTSAVDGFASSGPTGAITLELERCGSLRGFTIYNNINATKNGVKTFELKYYGEHGTLLGSQVVNVNNTAPSQTIAVFGGTSNPLMKFVHRIEMNITASFDSRAEIREIVLDGAPGECCP